VLFLCAFKNKSRLTKVLKMNLFELAHHPDAYKAVDNLKYEEFWWGTEKNSTEEQFKMLNARQRGRQADGLLERHVGTHTDENEFRMHLLFVHWATQ
jgi:hypothetical protein